MINISYEYNGLTINNNVNEWLSGARSLIDWVYVVEKVEGLDSAGMREARENKAAQHGQNDWQSFLAERLITFEGKIMGKSASNLETARQALLDAYIPDGVYRWLKFTPSGAVAKQAYCKIYSRKISEQYKDISYFRNFLINLIAIDPHIYSQEELTKTVYIPSTEGGRVFPKTYPKTYGTVQVGGKIVCTNSGNHSVLPIIKMYGPLSSPKIRNNNDGQKEILVNLVVADGDYLEIDFEEKTIMLNGTTSRYNYLDSDSEWWKILTGNNEIEFRDGGGNINGYAQIIYRHGWI